MKPRRRRSSRFDHIQNLLWEWGDNEAQAIHALGYPSMSVEARAIVDGRTHSLRVGRSGDWVQGVYIPRQEANCKETRSFKPRTPNYWPDGEILKIDRAIHRLSFKKQDAVKLRFLLNLPLLKCAESMENPMSERDFRRFLDEIYSELSHMLD